MKVLKWIFMFCILLFVPGCGVSSEIAALFSQMINTLLFIIPFISIVILLIFLMNKFILKEGRTNDRACSIVGVITFPIIFIIALGMKFGFGWIPVSIAALLGLGIGWFSYTLDELMVEFWKNRKVTIPGAAGLIFGGWLTSLLFTGIWLQGDMYITHKACASRVIIKRYTRHTDSDGDSYGSWDYYNHVDRVVKGTALPVLTEGKDYTLGRGYMFKKDKTEKEAFYWIGGHLFSEKNNKWKPFTWLRLMSNKVSFSKGKVQLVQSNFYGNPIKNGGNVRSYKNPLPEVKEGVVMPHDLPSPTVTGETIQKSFLFIKLLFSEDEYRPFAYFLFGMLVLEGLLFVLCPPLRTSVLVFFICSTIIVLIIMMIFAAKSGGIGSSRRRGGGSGGFGGRARSM